MKICFITNKYPNPIQRNVLVFVQQLVWTMADLGIDCTVICPVPINLNYRYMKFPNKIIEKTEKGSTVEVYFPKYIGFGQSDVFGFNPAKITTTNFERAVNRVINSMEELPKAIYGHFVTPAGIVSARVGRRFNIPSFMAYGESTPRTIEHFGAKEVANELSTLAGVISVSTHNKKELVDAVSLNEDLVEVFPNGYRVERFYPRGKEESRIKFGISKEKFVVCFVGTFNHRKGIERLMSAVNKLEDVYAICAGTGELTPNGEKCLYNKSVNNEELPYFYSAADVFVLPTINEGCCNAIIEAMACGLPIISSNLSFNDDIIDNTCSIRIDSLNEIELKNAIETLYNDREKLKILSNGSLEKAKSLTLDTRAKRIIKYISERIQEK